MNIASDEKVQKMFLELRSARKSTKSFNPSCELQLIEGQELVANLNRDGLIFLAERLLGLAAAGRSGSHFTVDKADIALDTDYALTFARSDG